MFNNGQNIGTRAVDFLYRAEAISSLPNRIMKFAYNADINTLPTNPNLALRYRGQVSTQCMLCGFPSQSLCHVLNKCKKALYQQRFNPMQTWLSPACLSCSHSFLLDHICDCQILCDLPGLQYTFPPQIATTDERPCRYRPLEWLENVVSFWLHELMIPFGDNFSDAHLKKTNLNHGLVQLCSENKYHNQLITIQVWFREWLTSLRWSIWKGFVYTQKESRHNFLVSLSQAAISGSFAIWCSYCRNIS
jgi:hypothetical protein